MQDLNRVNELLKYRTRSETIQLCCVTLTLQGLGTFSPLGILCLYSECAAAVATSRNATRQPIREREDILQPIRDRENIRQPRSQRARIRVHM